MSDDARPAAADALPEAARSSAGPVRRRSPFRDIAISLLVLVVPLVALVALCAPEGDEIQPIDAGPAYAGARAEAGFPVRQPTDVDGWKATNASFRTNPDKTAILRVSYLTRDGGFLQLIQSDVPADRLIPDELGNGAPRGEVTIAGVAWQRYGARRDDDHAFVLLERDVTVIAVGDAPDEDVVRFLRGLRRS